MARRKKKSKRSKKVAATIKYEVYGILILIFSVVTVAGQGVLPGMGTVGHALSSICLYLAGNFYFVIPLIFGYLGLHVMVKRKFPDTWTARMTGVTLLILAVLVFSHIHLFASAEPGGKMTAGEIMRQPAESFREMVTHQVTPNEYKAWLGGGQIGALAYGMLYFFFDNLGAKLIDVVMFLIGIMFLTGLSYVRVFFRLRQFLRYVGRRMQRGLSETMYLLGKKRTQAKNARPPGRKAATAAYAADLDLEDDLEESLRPGRGKSPVFELFKQSAAKTEAQAEAVDETPPWEEPSVEHASVDLPDALEGNEEAYVREYEFRDFQDVALSDAPFPGEEEEPPAPNMGSVEAEETDAPLLDDADLTLSGAASSADKPKAPYHLPPFSLLARPVSAGKGGDAGDFRANARKLEATLESFGVRAKILQVVRGPSVTRYEIQPDIGVKVSRIVSLTDDIALALAAKDIRMEAPIPGKSAIGIEVPNTEISIVTLREVMESSAFHEAESKLSIVLGRDISGQPVVGNLARMPHLLVAGATGSGKSVCINGIITSVLYKARPDEVKFLMIDPKMVELNVYNGIPHLLAPVVTDPRRASLALKKIVQEMEHRYEMFSKYGTRNMDGYNTLLAEKGEETLPYIVVIVDELADLMMVAAKDVEDSICRIAQKARAAGIHLIIATQRPSVDVITGLIKANIPSRIAFGVSSQVDSRTILDMAGAEKLLGRGDMLFLPVGASKPVRLQGAFLSDQEVESVVQYVSSQEKAEYREEIVPEVDDESQEDGADNRDELFDQAVAIVLEAKQASVSLLQRRMRVGYTRAARLIDSMEAAGIVGPYEGSKPREVLMTYEQYQSRLSS